MKNEIDNIIHDVVWNDKKLNTKELVEIISEKTGLNVALNEAEKHCNNLHPPVDYYNDHYKRFEKVRPSPFMKDPIGYVFKKLFKK